MKQLLLVCMLCPVLLHAQTRRKAIMDSFKAVTDVNGVAALINNHANAKVEQLRVSDSGEYITIAVRVRVTNVDIKAVLPQPIVRIRISELAAGHKDTLTVLPLPALVLDPEVVSLRTVNQLAVNPAVIPSAKLLPIPPVPEIIPEPFELPLVDCSQFAIIFALPPKVHFAKVPIFEQKKMPVEEMHLSPEGYSLLEKMEGFSPTPYSLKDGGVTIGFGFFVPDGEHSRWDKSMTIEEAEILIRQKMPAYEDQVKQYVNVPLTQEEFDALTMMAYNLGGFSKATSIINDINSYADFEKLQKDWMRFVHSKAPGVMKGLMNRRRDELQVRNESDYQPQRKIQIFKNRQ